MCHEIELDGPVLQTLILLVSEVVSNAVLHSAAPPDEDVGFSAAVYDGTVRVTVTDGGDGFVPCARDPKRIEGGYGLYLLEKAAARWGVEGGAATSVWFELDFVD
jgi:anti-sigma regulatory factor (Ser/Thr protein kinase)